MKTLRYDIPYRALRTTFHLTAIYIAYVFFQIMFYPVTPPGQLQTLRQHAIKIFNTSERILSQKMWNCDTKNMTTGFPWTSTSNGVVRFPWVHSQNKHDKMHHLSTCMKTWFAERHRTLVCGSSYTLGASTNAIVTRLHGQITILWDPVATPATTDTILLQINDIADRNLTYGIRAPRKIIVNYTRIDISTQGNDATYTQNRINGTILSNFEAHCVWSYVGTY